MPRVACFVAVPVAGFRAPHAREYWETLTVPPPSTIYGMLCAAVGEPDRLVHRGAELAIGLLARPVLSRVVRTLWRVKDRNIPPGLGENKRPDFQELLMGIRLAVHVRSGMTEEARPALADRLDAALGAPASVTRFGGLSLGESTHLVDELRPLRTADLAEGGVEWLVLDPDGPLALPVWPDHVGSAGTVFRQFRLETGGGEPPAAAWTAIAPAGWGW